MRKFLLTLSLAAAASASTVWRVVPGSSVGPIQLGQSYLQANQVLTPAQARGTATAAYLDYAEGVGLECQNQRITQIVLHRTSFSGKVGPVVIQLPGNLAIGCSVAQMQSALGPATTSRALPVAKGYPAQIYYAYTKLGLGARSEGGKIVEFAVW